MDKKEFVIRQLGRTKNKKYEAYVVTRIIHLLNDLSIKFVTQQYVNRPEGRALTDLFFPQLKLHIEVDEGQHFTIENINADKIREADIVNATGHKIERVDATKSIEDINNRIDQIVSMIKKEKEQSSFEPWNIDTEFNPETYIKLGYIDILDNVAFKTIKDACNCFGHKYAGYQSAGASHPYQPDTMLWFPKLFPNGEWDNNISDDEKIIIEKNVHSDKAIEHINSHINNKKKHKHIRVVFAKVKGNLGDTLYRFRGVYGLDVDSSNKDTGLIWKRTDTRVKTYP
jgi:very-short-patch-repair endonuclease